MLYVSYLLLALASLLYPDRQLIPPTLSRQGLVHLALANNGLRYAEVKHTYRYRKRARRNPKHRRKNHGN